jgi:hypothetical protein
MPFYRQSDSKLEKRIEVGYYRPTFQPLEVPRYVFVLHLTERVLQQQQTDHAHYQKKYPLRYSPLSTC